MWIIRSEARYQRPRSKEVLQPLGGEVPAKGICYQKQLLFYKTRPDSLWKDQIDRMSQCLTLNPEKRRHLVSSCLTKASWNESFKAALPIDFGEVELSVLYWSSRHEELHIASHLMSFHLCFFSLLLFITFPLSFTIPPPHYLPLPPQAGQLCWHSIHGEVQGIQWVPWWHTQLHQDASSDGWGRALHC